MSVWFFYLGALKDRASKIWLARMGEPNWLGCLGERLVAYAGAAGEVTPET
jgi:hypothetical protein